MSSVYFSVMIKRQNGKWEKKNKEKNTAISQTESEISPII